MSAMVTLALRLPAALGVKVTLIVQVPLTANVLEQVLVWAKSLAFVPLIAILLMFKAAVPVFVSVTVLAAVVVFTTSLPKLRLLGLKPAPGAGPLMKLFKMLAVVCWMPAFM